MAYEYIKDKIKIYFCYSGKKLNDIAPNVSLAPVPPKRDDPDTDVCSDDVIKTTSLIDRVTSPHEDRNPRPLSRTGADSDLNESLEIDVSSTDDNETVSNNSDSGKN